MQAEITRRTDPCTGDVCIRMLHDSGLEIRVMEMPAFSTSYAQFGTRFGSVHRRFRRAGDAAYTEVPAGIAHYLEHKLFENPDSSISAAFSRLGARDNAYTDFDRTVYYFQTQQHFYEALELLTGFVQAPYFTQESVEKERSIIAQELRECLDDPADQVFFQMLGGLYPEHPVHTDVLGTEESILQITPEMLYTCHELFYHPQNMVLCCAGNVEAEKILQLCDSMIKKRTPVTAAPFRYPERAPAGRLIRRKTMPVGKTQFAAGFRSRPESGAVRLKESLLSSLTAELLIGSSSPLYQRLLAEGLINDTFSTDCFAGDGWFTVLAEGESDCPEAVLDALCAEIGRVKKEGADRALFDTLKRAAYGDTVISMNHPEAACAAMLDSFIWDGISPFARAELLAQLTADDVQGCLETRFCTDNICLSVIEPESLGKEESEL
ncbi:MAG: insulinase family protein [Oscillospiraceae bacterium]|nr:insulinase family protein [Oscillospiraceae bacterium]